LIATFCLLDLTIAEYTWEKPLQGNRYVTEPEGEHRAVACDVPAAYELYVFEDVIRVAIIDNILYEFMHSWASRRRKEDNQGSLLKGHRRYLTSNSRCQCSWAEVVEVREQELHTQRTRLQRLLVDAKQVM